MSWSAVFHFGIIFIFALLLAGFQTTFWHQIFGAVQPPLLWLVVFTYLALYRSGMTALFQLTMLVLMLAAFTAISVKTFYVGLLIYFMVIYILKSRIFWSGPGYFLLVCSVGSVAFHLIFFVLALFLEKTAVDVMFLERLTQVLLTPAFAFPIYWIMVAVDDLFVKKELKADVGASAYD